MNSDDIVKIRVYAVQGEENKDAYIIKYRSDLHPNDVEFVEQTQFEPLAALQSYGFVLSDKEKETLKNAFLDRKEGINIDAEQKKLDTLKQDLDADKDQAQTSDVNQLDNSQIAK